MSLLPLTVLPLAVDHGALRVLDQRHFRSRVCVGAILTKRRRHAGRSACMYYVLSLCVSADSVIFNVMKTAVTMTFAVIRTAECRYC
jgi:hypothetical protein